MISKNAAERILTLSKKEGTESSVLRVTVNSGGCFGLQYAFDFEEGAKEGDHTFKEGAATVVMDEISLNFLKGSELDYIDEMMGAYFTIKNPNATSSCGCGSSFSV